jgi:hypothetical protein
MDTQKIKSYLAPPNLRMQLYCKIYLWVSGIAVLMWSLLAMYIIIGEGKSGEYCDYTQDLHNYHVIINNQPCLLQWYILFEFSLLLAIFLVPIQLPIWILFWVLKVNHKK